MRVGHADHVWSISPTQDKQEAQQEEFSSKKQHYNIILHHFKKNKEEASFNVHVPIVQ